MLLSYSCALNLSQLERMGCDFFISIASTYQSYGLETQGIYSKYMGEYSI